MPLFRRPEPMQPAQVVWEFVARLIHSLQIQEMTQRVSNAPISQVLQEARQRAGEDLEHFIALAARGLVQRLAELQAQAERSAALQWQLEASERARERLLQQLWELDAASIQQRLQALEKERRMLLAERAQAEAQIRTLQDALSREQALHRRQVAQLEATIADLNRVVAGQQEQLNAFLDQCI